MEIVLAIFGFVSLIGFLYWYIEIYTVRQHWREAEEWAKRRKNGLI